MFTCESCGYQSVKWAGRCSNCGAWESFIEESRQKDRGPLVRQGRPVLLKDIEKSTPCRVKTGISELDRILGGGLVEGSVILVGGPPGAGKSTLLLEVCARLQEQEKTLYVSAEESPRQISLRAERLNSSGLNNIYISGGDQLEEIHEYVKKEKFKFVVVDSIQVVGVDSCQAPKGSAAQVRVCSDYLTHLAKTEGVTVFIVGHITKDGAIAGPKLLEHIVDCVLYFEGELLSDYRILRSIKNRFGPTGEIAVFEMRSDGLKEVFQTSDIFLPHRRQLSPGSSVVCAVEGLRPILIELQSLVSRANFGMPRRRSLGYDFNRFSLLIAIAEKRLKMALASEDVFLNVAGGLKIGDPAADLGAILAVVSSYREKPVSFDTVFIGEIGLGGELRKTNNINLRVKEAARSGFTKCVVPQANLGEVDKNIKIDVQGYSGVRDVVDSLSLSGAR